MWNPVVIVDQWGLIQDRKDQWTVPSLCRLYSYWANYTKFNKPESQLGTISPGNWQPFFLLHIGKQASLHRKLSISMNFPAITSMASSEISQSNHV